MMIDTSLLGYKWRGAFNANTAYKRGDVVRKDGVIQAFDGSSFGLMTAGQQSAPINGLLRTGSNAKLPGVEGQEIIAGADGLPEFQFDAGRRSNAAVALAKVDFGNCGYEMGTPTTNAAIMTDGSVMAWGTGDTLGVGAATTRFRPVRVAFPKDTGRIVKLFASVLTTYAIDAHGRLWGWGGNANGQLGIGNTISQPNPVLLNGRGQLPANAKVVEVIAGVSYQPGYMTIALTDTGEAYFAGLNTTDASGTGGPATINAWTRIPIDAFIVSGLVSGDTARPGTTLIDDQGRAYFAGNSAFTSSINNTAGTGIGPALWTVSEHKPVKSISFRNNFTVVSSTSRANEYGSGVVFQDGTIATRLNAVRSQEIRDLSYPGVAAHQFVPDSRIDNIDDLIVGGGREFAIALKKDGTVWAVGRKTDFMGAAYPRDNEWEQITELGSNNVKMQGITGYNEMLIGFLKSDGTAAFIGSASGKVSGVAGDGFNTIGFVGPTVMNRKIIDFTIAGRLWLSECTLYSTFLCDDGSVFTTGFGGNFTLGNEYASANRLTPSIVIT
jgi:hypothetical protein